MFQYRRLLIVLLVLGLLAVNIHVSAQEVARKDTLIVAFEGGPAASADNFNPFVPSNNLARGMHQTMVEHLFYLNYETGQTVPWLAKSLEASPDFTQYTIHLREGVKWNDDQPFTAADVVFTFNMLRDHPTLNWGAAVQAAVAKAEAVDDLTVKVTLTAANPRFGLDTPVTANIWGTAPVVPKHLWEGQDPTTFTFSKPVFTGPYVLNHATTTEFDYDRNDNWWAVKTGFQKLPAPRRIIFVDQGTEEARAAQLQNNEVDSEPLLSIGAFETVKANNPKVIGWSDESPYAYIDPCPHFFYFNAMVKPWDDPQMRWAVAHAINRERFVSLVFEGYYTEAARFLFPAYPPLDAYLNDIQDLLKQYAFTYDVKQTASILEGKGYTKNADGKWVDAQGQPLTLELMMLNPEEGGIVWGVATSAYTEDLEGAGFTVKVKALSVAAQAEATAVGDWQLAQQWSCGSVVDPWQTLDNFNKRWIKPLGERASFNPNRWSNDEYSALVDKIGALAPGDPAIKPLFRQAMEIWLKNAPAIPMDQQVRINPFNTTYWTNWPTKTNNYVQPPSWWAQTLLIVTQVQPAQ